MSAARQPADRRSAGRGSDVGRRARLAKVHIAAKALGLDDDAYRDLLERETGKRSAKDLDNAGLDRVIGIMTRLGFEPASKRVRPGVEAGSKRRTPSVGARHAQARKARSLWLSLYHLGEVRDPSETAMDRFVLRQCGISSAAWMRDPEEAFRVIEALKAWCRRAGVGFESWEMAKPVPAVKRPRLAVIEAQLVKLGEPAADAWSLGDCTAEELDAHIRRLGQRVRARAASGDPA